MALTWQEFIDAVVRRLSDGQPAEPMFTEAIAEYLRARIAQELRGDKDGYAIHQNRYTALRRKLCGFLTTRDDATLRADVRLMVSGIVPDDKLFALACSYWVQAHGVGQVNRNQEEAGAWMGMYRQRRTELLGFTPSFANTAALRAQVEPLLVTSALSDNLSAYLDAQLEAAKSDLVGLAQWVNQQIAAAKADLESLHERVEKEIRSAVIGAQELVTVYQIGQVTTLAEDDVTADGLASIGSLPEQAALREAWMVWPDGADRRRRRRCTQVAWEGRDDLLVNAETSTPLIAIDPYARAFLVAPALVEDEIELDLHWDGVKLDFESTDATPFDEGLAEAVALRVQAALAPEFGDAAALAREYTRQANDRIGLLYVETLRRKSVANPGP